MLLTPQFSALVALSGLLGWIIGHQASHCVALQAGRAELNLTLASIMGLETFSGMLFLVWYAYMMGIRATIWLAVNAFIFRLCLVWLEKPLGLTQRAWIISAFVGIPLVPVLLAALVWLVLFPIPD
jgi:hypothetical protein